MDWLDKEHIGALATFIAALFGFTGVVVTLVINRRKDVKLEKQKRHHERMVLRAALQAELQNLVRIIEDEIAFVRNPENPYTWVPLLNFFGVYEESLDKLGLLDEDEVQGIVQAYYTYHEHAGYVVRDGDTDPETPFVVGGNVGYEINTKEQRHDLEKTLQPMIRDAKAAIDRIKAARERSHGI
jgi:hypothetical protein